LYDFDRGWWVLTGWPAEDRIKIISALFRGFITLAGWDSTEMILIARIKREDTDGWVGIAPIVTLLIKWPGMEA
jgi:hypothetical protein